MIMIASTHNRCAVSAWRSRFDHFPSQKKTERDWDYLGRENISWIKTHNTTTIHHPWVRLAIEVVVTWIRFCCDVCVFAVSTIYHDNTWKGKAFYQCMCILSPLLPTLFVLHANYYRLTVNGCSDVSNTRETSSKSFLLPFTPPYFTPLYSLLTNS